MTLTQRRNVAIQCRAWGFSYRKIAQLLGVSVDTAYRDVQQGLEDLSRDVRKIRRSVRMLKSTRWFKRHWPQRFQAR